MEKKKNEAVIAPPLPEDGVLRPTFFGRFRCRAGACAHSCCRGWEIDVDGDSAARYLACPPPFGDRLRQSLACGEEGYSFRLTREEACPFLNREGLCELILTLGEDALCDICREHPRFYGAAGDLEYAGLGLSCEAAAQLLLSEKTLRFTDGETAFPLSAILRSLTGEAAELRFSPETGAAELDALLRLYSLTEPIDGRWTAELSAMRADLSALCRRAEIYRRTYDRQAFDRILQYILFRRLEDLPEYGLAALTAFARLGAQFIFCAAAAGTPLCESVRRWSEQIEYSTENVGILLDDIINGRSEP